MPYSAVKIGEHIETLPLKSSRFRNWLYRIYYTSEKKVLNSEAASNVINVLKAKAEFDSGDRKNLYLRVATIPEEPDTIYYDLTNKNWQFVRITADGWNVIESNDLPVIFKRYSSQQPQVYPSEPNGYPPDIFDKFIKLINIKGDGEDTKLLLKCYIISLFFANIPKPISMAHGEQGAAQNHISGTGKDASRPKFSQDPGISKRHKRTDTETSP